MSQTTLWLHCTGSETLLQETHVCRSKMKKKTLPYCHKKQKETIAYAPISDFKMHGLLSSFIIVINVTSSRELKNVKYLNADSVTIIKMDERAFMTSFVLLGANAVFLFQYCG